jgi:chromosome segregation ATPase
MFDRIEAELKGVQQALYSSRAVSTAPLSSGDIEVGDEPAQLRRLADSTEAHLRRVQEEKEQATEALKQAKEEALEQRRVAQQEKDDLQAKFAEDRAQIQKEKEQLLMEQIGVKEAVTRALRSVSGLAQMEEETTESQVGKLVEAIQQLQARVAELELQAVPSTPQEVRDQREETARSAVERIKALALECKQLSSRSAQTYEHLAEDPELRTLESQLQEAKKQAATVQAQLKPLSAVERMKRSQEQRTVQQQVHAIQSKVMEVTQRLQPVQDEACTLFEEIEGQGAQLEQVVTTVEQRLEGPVTEKVIQEFTEQEALAKQQVEAARAKLEAFEAEFPRSE